MDPRRLIVVLAALVATAGAAVARAPAGDPSTGTTASGVVGTSQLIARPGDATTDASMTTAMTNEQCWRQASPTSSGGANEACGFFSLNIPSGHGNGAAYEAMPLYARCVTADSNTRQLGAYDCVGGEFQAVTAGNGQLLRVWGVDATVYITSGSDGYATGFENDIYNSGTTGGLQTPTAKRNFFGVCLGPNNCTAIMDAGVGGGALYTYGFPMIRQIFTAGAPVFAVVDSAAKFAPIAGIFADGHTAALNNSEVIGAAGAARYSGYYTGVNSSSLSLRWNAGASATSESGANAGSDFQICAYSDSGALIGCPLGITRSSGLVAFGAGRVATLEATSVTVTKELASASIRSPIIHATSFLRSATTTYANLSTADPSPTIGDQLVISDASACTINTAVTSGGGTAHACPVVYTGSWVALVSH